MNKYIITILTLMIGLSLISPSPAFAQNDCFGCVEEQCDQAKEIIKQNHQIYENEIMRMVSEEFRKHRRWLRNVFFQTQLLPAMAQFSRQMTAVAMHQTFAIGQLFDAENKLKTQRAMQTLKIQAHNDYHPSDGLCTFGTSVRSLASSDQNNHFNKAALATKQLDRHVGKGYTPGFGSPDHDIAARWEVFTKNYCDPKNNGWLPQNAAKTGLQTICQSAPDPQRANIDIDYLRLISEPRTLDIDFTNTTKTKTETDILSLSKNLYGHDLLTRQFPKGGMKTKANQALYLETRALAAKRQVAEDSFNAIVTMKSSGSPDMSNKSGGSQSADTSKYLYQILKELGVSDQPGSGSNPGNQSAAEELLGKDPSYYAQLEVLAKRIYQSPDFYVNLYDRPANIKRKSVALLAIERMMDQALLESQLRQEMSVSVLLNTTLETEEWNKIQRELSPKE